MKFTKFIFMILFVAGTLIIESCHKEHELLKITFPAAYIVNGSSSTLSVIEIATDEIVGEVHLNGATFPHHIYLNPAKDKLAVAITSTDLSGGHAGHGGTVSGLRVQIIKAVTGEIEKEIALSKIPHNAIFNQSGTELWIGQMDLVQSQVLIYNTADWSLQNTINVGKGLSEVTFSHDGTMAYACNTNDGTVTVINASAKTIMATLTVGSSPVGAWSASNGFMYVDNEISQTISEISVSGMNITQTINLGFKPGFVAYNTTTAELWVSDATNGRVVYYVRDTGTGDWIQSGAIITGTDPHAIAFAQNDAKAYVTNQGSNTVSVIDAVTHLVVSEIAVGGMPNGIAILE